MQRTDLTGIDLWAQRLARRVAVLACFFTRCWLGFAILALVLATGLPLLPPLLMHRGHYSAGQLGYTLFSPFCHQLPERSFFLFGEQWVYSLDEIVSALGRAVPSRYVGNPELGFKMAVCERCISIYGVGLIASLIFVLARRYVRPVPVWVFPVMIAPMAIDGTGQLVGLWTSTWLSRVITGGLFGLAGVLLAYPLIDEVMTQAHRQLRVDIESWRRNGY